MSRRAAPPSAASGAPGVPSGSSVLGASSFGLRPSAPRYTLGLSRPAPSSAARPLRLSSGGGGVPDEIPRAPSFSAYETLDAAEFCYDLRERIGAALGRPPPRASLAASRSSAASRPVATSRSAAELQPTEQDMPDDLAAILAPQPQRVNGATLKDGTSSVEDARRLSNSEWLQRAEAAHAARHASRAHAREAAVQTEAPLPHLRANHAGPSSEIMLPGSTPRAAAPLQTPGAAVDRARLAGRAVEELLGIGGVAPENGERFALADSFVPLAGEGDEEADADAEAEDDLAGPSALFDAPGGIEEVLRRRAQLADAQPAASPAASSQSNKRRAPLIEELRQDTPTLEEILQRNAAELGAEEDEEAIGSDSESEESSVEDDGSAQSFLDDEQDGEAAESEEDEDEDEDDELGLDAMDAPRGSVQLPITNGMASRRLVLEEDDGSEHDGPEEDDEDEDDDGLGEEDDELSDAAEPRQAAQAAAGDVIELLDSDSDDDRAPPPPARVSAPVFALQEAELADESIDESGDEQGAPSEHASALWQKEQDDRMSDAEAAEEQPQPDEPQDEIWDALQARALPPPPFEQLADAAMSQAPMDFAQPPALPHGFPSSMQPFSDPPAAAHTGSSSLPASQLDPALFGLTAESGDGSAADSPSITESAQVQNWDWSLGGALEQPAPTSQTHTPVAESGFFSDLLNDQSSSVDSPLHASAPRLPLDDSAIAAAVQAAQAHASSLSSPSSAVALPPGTPGSERPAPELLDLADTPAASSAALLLLKDQVTGSGSMATSVASEASAVKHKHSSAPGTLAAPVDLVSGNTSVAQQHSSGSAAAANESASAARSQVEASAPSTPSAVPLLSRQTVSAEPAVPAEGAALLAFKREHAAQSTGSTAASLAATDGAASTAAPLSVAVSLPLSDASALASFKAQLPEQSGQPHSVTSVAGSEAHRSAPQTPAAEGLVSLPLGDASALASFKAQLDAQHGHPQSVTSVAGSEAHRSAPQTPIVEGMPVGSAKQLLAFKTEVERNGALASAASSQAGSEGPRGAAVLTSGLPGTPVATGAPALVGTPAAAPVDRDPLVADAGELIALKTVIEEDRHEMPQVSAAPSLAGSDHAAAAASVAGSDRASAAPSPAVAEQAPEAPQHASTAAEDTSDAAAALAKEADDSDAAPKLQDAPAAGEEEDELSTPVGEAEADEVLLLPKSQPFEPRRSSAPAEPSGETRDEAAASTESAISIADASPPRIADSPPPVESSDVVREQAPAEDEEAAAPLEIGTPPPAEEAAAPLEASTPPRVTPPPAEGAAAPSDAGTPPPADQAAPAAPASPVRRSSPRKRAASPIEDSSSSTAAERKPLRSVKRKVEETVPQADDQAGPSHSAANEASTSASAAGGFVSKASGFLTQMFSLRRNRHFHHHGAGPARVASSPRSVRSATPASIKGAAAAGSSPLKAPTSSAGNSSDVEMADAEPALRKGSSVASEQAAAAEAPDGVQLADQEMQEAEDEDEAASVGGYVGPATRSRCSYHLITLPSATSPKGRCTFAVPGCSIAHDKLAKEDARHLGPASAGDNETKEWFDPQMLPGELYHALSRICDVDLLEDVAIMPASKPEGVKSWHDDGPPEDEQAFIDDPHFAPKEWLHQGASSPLSTPPPQEQPRPLGEDEEMRSPSLPPATRGSDVLTVEIDAPAAHSGRRSAGKTRATPEASASTSPQTPKRARRVLRHPRRSDPSGPEANYQPRSSDSDDDKPRSRKSSRRAGSQASPAVADAAVFDDADLSIASLEQRASAPPADDGEESELAVPALKTKRTYQRRKANDSSYRESIADPAAPPESEEEDVAARAAQEAAAESARKASSRRRAERQKAERAEGREVEAELALEPQAPGPSSVARSGSAKSRRRVADPAYKPAAGSDAEGSASDEQPGAAAPSASSRVSPARPKPRPRARKSSSAAAATARKGSTPRAGSAKAATPDMGSTEPAASAASPGPSSAPAPRRRSGRASSSRVSREAE